MRRVLFSFISLLTLAATPFTTARAEVLSEDIVVTATRTPQPRDKTGNSISVIDARTLSDQQIVAVTDALQQTPGLVVVRNGPFGQNATASLRGAEAGQTLVLIDGVRINDPSSVD